EGQRSPQPPPVRSQNAAGEESAAAMPPSGASAHVAQRKTKRPKTGDASRAALRTGTILGAHAHRHGRRGQERERGAPFLAGGADPFLVLPHLRLQLEEQRRRRPLAVLLQLAAAAQRLVPELDGLLDREARGLDARAHRLADLGRRRRQLLL